MTKKLQIFRKRESAMLPKMATKGSAGLDLSACLEEPLLLMPGESCLVPTGLAMALPSDGYVGLIFARSGIASKFGVSLPNGVGVIDSDYRGEIFVSLINLGKDSYTINHADRIAQLVVMPICQLEVEEVLSISSTERGQGGFGSTGK